MGLISPVEIPEGSSFLAEFEFPTIPGVFRTQVHVRNKAGFRYGFSFVAVDEGGMALLRKYQRRPTLW